MVNNFTNSNKMNNHLKSLSTKKTTTYVNGYSGLDLAQAQKCA
jgi:hypothetical protein